MKNFNLPPLHANVWKHLHFKVNSIAISLQLVKKYISLAFVQIFKDKNIKSWILIFFKVHFIDHTYATINKVARVQLKDKNAFISAIMAKLSVMDEYYNETPIKEIIITYLIIPDNLVNANEKADYGIEKPKVDMITMKSYRLPKTANYAVWGLLILNEDNLYIIAKPNSNLYYHVKSCDGYNEVELKRGKNVILCFKDTFKDPSNLTTFTREIGLQTFIFEKGELVFQTKEIKTNYLKTIKQAPSLFDKILVFDIETYNENKENEVIKVPYLICLYDGIKKISFYLSDFKNSVEMIREFIKEILKNKYKGYCLYAHNLSKFDGGFLLKHLVKFNIKIDPLFKDSKWISVKLNYGKKKNLWIRDSFLLLPDSLKELSKAFNIKDPKYLFPHKFVTLSKILNNYIGKYPNKKHFYKITSEEYKTQYADNWNLREEAIKYCMNDCIALHQILSEFNNKIYDLYGLCINKYPTIPSLALGIFRSNFLSDDMKIPLIGGPLYDQLYKSYTGGATDMYIPHGKNIYWYDVNSLYPSQMLMNDMPVGKIIQFKGDISKSSLWNDCFGFFNADIYAPDNLKNPILQTRMKTKNSFRTIAPLGKWTAYIFSEELKNALKVGYKFKIKSGFLFEKKDIFSSYVSNLYKLRLEYPKGHPLNYIAKLLLNSLYGRFGMSYRTFYNHYSIVDNNEILDITRKYDINDVIELQPDKSLISITDIESIEKAQHVPTYFNTSIGIASAITAYGRIAMSKYKNSDDFNLYYSDTDSIFIDKPLPKEAISNEIGYWKLEDVLKEATFLSAKLYGAITNKLEFIKFVNGREVKVKEFTKIRGYMNALKYNDLKSLLKKGKYLDLKQDKGFINISKGYISFKTKSYKLVTTDLKRRLIYKNNRLVATKPIVVDNIKNTPI